MLIGTGLLKIVHDVIMFMQPYILEKLLEHMMNGGGRSKSMHVCACLCECWVVVTVDVGQAGSVVYGS